MQLKKNKKKTKEKFMMIKLSLTEIAADSQLLIVL